ncbi:MAG: hypothetical protein PHC61_12560 [Chitinivibrionales bacterium]|nr:hypothetical protein [Chitinivibrionales bacterium]
MITLSDLRTSLLDLLHELQKTEITLIIGGGFGIYLKTDYVRRFGIRTLLQELPESRSTNDLDLFLRPELLIASEKLKPLSRALNNLGFRVIPEAAKYQFVKPGPGESMTGSIKIDLLTGPQGCFKGTAAKADDRRVRPNPSIGLHAHPVNEVPTLEEGLLSITLDGKTSQGINYTGNVFVPHPYSFLMMKLFAFVDRYNDANKEYGRYHALDLYTIVAATTEKEWDEMRRFRGQMHSDRYVLQAESFVEKYFSAMNSMGMIRMRESRYCRPELQLDKFMSIIQEIFLHVP